MIVLLADRRRREVQSSSYIQSKTANHTQNQQTVSDLFWIYMPWLMIAIIGGTPLSSIFKRKSSVHMSFAGKFVLSFRSRALS
jgi:hypothetical protein